MFALKFRPLLVFLSLSAAWGAAPAGAALVQKLNLDEMCSSADRVFRGTVVEAHRGSAAVGGGEIPTVTYRLHVSETFKGSFEAENGQLFAEIRMVTSAATSNSRRHSLLDFLPRLEVGSEYLLLTTRPSASGLSTTVGLGQGCFSVTGPATGATALNEVGNAGLFDRMTSPPAGWSGGPVSYDELRQRIQGAVSP
ncbi:MAG: hypothetical protein AAF604_15970 [Acidobacteriota bacterium]